MTRSIRILHIAPLAAGAFAVAAGWLVDIAQAQQQRGTQALQFEPITQPPLAPDFLAVPRPAVHAGADKFDLDKRGSAAQPLTIPKGFDIGNYQFDFDARRTKDVTMPGVITDSGEKSNLSKVTGPKQDSALPNYFGLKLSVPTH